MLFLLQNGNDADVIDLATPTANGDGRNVWASAHVDFLAEAADEDVQISGTCIIITENQYNEYQKLHKHAEDFKRALGVV